MESLGQDESMSDVYTKDINMSEQLCEHRWYLDINAGCMYSKDECMKVPALMLMAACCHAGHTEVAAPVPYPYLKWPQLTRSPGTRIFHLLVSNPSREPRADMTTRQWDNSPQQQPSSDMSLIAWKSKPNTLLRDLYAPEPKDTVLKVSLLVLFRVHLQ